MATVHTYRVQVVETGTHEPTYKWHEIKAETPGLAALEAKHLNMGMGGLGDVNIVSVEDMGVAK